MKCPNCDHDIDPEKPTALRLPDFVHSNPNLGHGEDCFLRALLVILRDREDHDLTGIRLEAIDLNELWDEVGGPAGDWLERALGLTEPPEQVTITRADEPSRD